MSEEELIERQRRTYRWALFQKVADCQTFACIVTERDAWVALNFIRFLSGPIYERTNG
jgi:hypothetical protein